LRRTAISLISTGDGAYTYTFDAEKRITSAAGVTYTYDGNGMRVKKSNGTLYWRGISGDALAESDLSGNITNEYVFFAGRRVARRDSTGNVFYYFADHLGSTRTITDSTGHICYDADFTPYGQEINHTNSCPQNYKFTGYERDSETGNDYAFARYYNPRLGRFMSTDPLGGRTGDPQSLNLYAYVGNRPLTFTDPTGMCVHMLYDDASCFAGGFFGSSMTCNVDGIATDCAEVSRLLELGGADVCPNNNCFGLTHGGDGRFYRFFPEGTYVDIQSEIGNTIYDSVNLLTTGRWLAVAGGNDLWQMPLFGMAGGPGSLPPGANPWLQAAKQATERLKPPTPPVSVSPDPRPILPPSGELPWNKMTLWQRIIFLSEKAAEIYDNYQDMFIPFVLPISPCGGGPVPIPNGLPNNGCT